MFVSVPPSAVMWSGLTDGLVGVSLNLPTDLIRAGRQNGPPCTPCPLALLRLHQMEDKIYTSDWHGLAWPGLAWLLSGCFSGSARGLSWKLGLSGYNKSLIIRIMEGRNGWRGSVLQPATDVGAPSPRSRQTREIIKCHHGEREYFEW